MTQKKNADTKNNAPQSSEQTLQSAPKVEKIAPSPATNTTQNEKKVEQKQPDNQKNSSSSNGLAAFALVLACIALLAAGFLWYQNKENLDQKHLLEKQVVGAEQITNSLRESQQAHQKTRATVQQQHDLIQQQSDAISSSNAQITHLGERLDKLQKQLSPDKSKFLLAQVRTLIYQAQSVISLGNQNINYVGDLLLETQGILDVVKDPSWDTVRRALVVDIAAINAVQPVSIITVYEQIEILRQAIRSLTYAPKSEPEQQAEEPQLDNAEPADLMENFANKVVNQLKSMVIIRENQDGVMLQLNADSFQHIQLLLESGLSQAQLSLMQLNEKAFEESIKQVQQTLEKRLSQYQLEELLTTTEGLLNTTVFDSLDGLTSYPALQVLEEKQK